KIAACSLFATFPLLVHCPSNRGALGCSLGHVRSQITAPCLKTGACVVSPTGKQWTQANIGNALAGRDIARHLRELGENTGGPAPLSKRNKSQFLSALDTALQAA